jgi:hypothetical protein
MMKKILIPTVAAAAVLAFSSSSYATTILLTTPGIVGVNDLNSFNDNANPSTRVVYANTLLAMGANASQPTPYPADDSQIIGYKTGPTDYTGTVSEASTVIGTNVVPAGSGYVLAKYDGPNAGYVLFYIPHFGSLTIPQTAGYAFWDGGATKEYGLSGYTVYTSVPDGGSMAMLLGAALMGLAGFRRMLT